MDSQFDEAVKAAKAAKLEIAELDAKQHATRAALTEQQRNLAKAEEEASAVLMDVAGKLTGARERLQTALQTINDAPVTAETKAEAVEELPAEAAFEPMSYIDGVARSASYLD